VEEPKRIKADMLVATGLYDILKAPRAQSSGRRNLISCHCGGFSEVISWEKQL
jgi:hypothetical protein